MIHPIRAWNAFFFRPVSARPLGALRIAFGLVALMNLAYSAVEVDYWYSNLGLLQGSEARVIAGPLQLSPLLWYQDPMTVRVAFGLTAAAGVLLTVGFFTRVMSVLFYLGMLSIQFRNLVSSSGADVLVMTFAFNLMFCPSGAAYSVDSWLKARRRGTLAEAIILPWGMRLIQIQISLVYAVACMLKVNGVMWMNGTALHYVFTNSEVRRFDFSFLTQYPILINLMTYSALVMEFSLAVFLWYRPARRVVIVMGLMLHAGIMLTINIPIFGELMWVGYLAFLTPTELDALLKPFNVFRWFRKPVAEATPAAFPASMMVRIDGPSAAVPSPHFVEPEPEFVRPCEESAEDYVESAREEAEIYGSFQIYM